MKKRVVKLDREQLRGFINEAIQGRQPGSPLWEMPRQRVEVDTWGLRASIENTIREFFEGMYNPDDPTMVTGGPEAWKEQCDDAAYSCLDKIEEVIEDAMGRLIEGYYSRH